MGTMNDFHQLEMEDGEILDVEFTCDYYIENDGIGAYEYWGHVEFDKGTDYPVIENVSWDKFLYNENENLFIQNWVNKNMEQMANSFCSKWEPEKEY